jgi:hypothetical protein
VQGFAVMVIHVWSSADHKRLFSFVVGVLAFDLAECRISDREYLTEREVHR